MKKRNIFGSILVIALFFAACLVLYAEDQGSPASEPPGKVVFLGQKCNMCHSVESQKIEKTTGGYQKSKEKNVPPDLTGIGTKHTAEWMMKYLKKEEVLDAKKHVKQFRGTDDELKNVTAWLESLK